MQIHQIPKSNAKKSPSRVSFSFLKNPNPQKEARASRPLALRAASGAAPHAIPRPRPTAPAPARELNRKFKILLQFQLSLINKFPFGNIFRFLFLRFLGGRKMRPRASSSGRRRVGVCTRNYCVMRREMENLAAFSCFFSQKLSGFLLFCGVEVLVRRTRPMMSSAK